MAVGKAAHHCEVAILHEVSGQPLPPGEVGEIATRGPHVMAGYWRRPQQTEAALRGGWLHTGDLGYLDSHGMLHLVGRLQEVIRTGGESVHPSEVERVLEEHPLVAQAAVFGLPDEKFGEKVTAAVVLRDDQGVGGSEADKAKVAIEREILAHCHRRLSRYKCPKQVHIMASLPKNGSGKVVKAQLRSLL